MTLTLPLTLPGLLRHHAASGAAALVGDHPPISYGDLLERSRRLAGGLAGLGLGRGDRVAIWLPNTPSWLETFFACGELGLIGVALNTRFRSGEVADILSRAGCRAVVLAPRVGSADLMAVLADCPAEALARLEHLIVEGDPRPVPGLAATPVSYRDLLACEPLQDGMQVQEPDAPCLIFTTSGTTKAPKFVLHDQRRIVGHGLDVARALRLGAGNAMLLGAPYCGTFGISQAFGALAAGARIVATPVWDASEALRLANLHGVTHTMATNDAVAQLLAASDARTPVPTMELVGYAGTNPTLADLPARAAARGFWVVGLYGSSELQALLSFSRPDADLPDRAEAGGLMVARCGEVRAADPETGAILPAGEMGELEFRVPRSQMVGYFGDEAATRAAVRPDGFFRSGDLGHVTPDRGFVFLGRLGDSMRLGGFLVNPAEIEAVLEEAPGIGQAQVVAVETARGPRAVGFVILRAGATLDEAATLTLVGRRLAAFKVPVRLFAVESFPVTVSANATKIQKGKLREQAIGLMGEAGPPGRVTA